MTLPECTTQDLTKEKSLWDIYSASRRIHSGKFNKMATSIVFGLLFLQCWISEQSVSSTIDVVRKVADIGLVAAFKYPWPFACGLYHFCHHITTIPIVTDV